MKQAHDVAEVEVFTRAGCAGCAALKGALDNAGIFYAELDVATPDGLAMATWYDLDQTVPQVVVRGDAVEIEMRSETWPQDVAAEVGRRLETNA